MNPFNFNTTSSVVFGAGSLKQLGELAATRLGKRVVFVTDKGMVKTGLVAQALSSLKAAGIEYHLYDDVQADPSEQVVLGATAQAHDFGASAVIGMGGGSSLDVAKLVAVLTQGKQTLDQIYGINQVHGGRLPLLLIPTTAGTGSEVTPISIITTGAHEKKGVVSPMLLPDIALLDPELTIGLPAHITAATGVDAMVHAIESYTSVNANNNPVSQVLATRALQLLSSNIRQAVLEPSNTQARSAMLLGSMLAGQAFANSPVAAVHALAYPLGGQYGITHGLSNALMLAHVLRYNAESCSKQYAELAPYIDTKHKDGSAQQLCAAMISSIEAIMTDIKLPQRLRDVDIPESACVALAEDAMKQTRLLVNNPRGIDQADALALYQAAW